MTEWNLKKLQNTPRREMGYSRGAPAKRSTFIRHSCHLTCNSFRFYRPFSPCFRCAVQRKPTFPRDELPTSHSKAPISNAIKVYPIKSESSSAGKIGPLQSLHFFVRGKISEKGFFITIISFHFLYVFHTIEPIISSI